MGKRNKKIPLGITVGTAMGLKFAYDNWKIANASGNGTEFITSMLTGYFPDGYAQANGMSGPGFNSGHAIPFYGPIAGGYVVSTYLGGPKGMNLNQKLSGVPLVKL